MAAMDVMRRGEATGVGREQLGSTAFEPGALAAIRYADPAAWTIAAAIARSLDGDRDAVRAVHDQVGVIVTSAEGPAETTAALIELARARGTSPVKFAAATAASLVGTAAIAFGFRGPALMLTLPPERGIPIGLAVAAGWLSRGQAAWVAVAACRRLVDGSPAARCLLLGRDRMNVEPDGAWLMEPRAA